MILADKIIDLRKKNGWSQEELAEKLDVSRQSVSKWESAQSVPDLNKILRLAEIFGVSTDYLLKDEMDAPEGRGSVPVDTESSAVRVSMEEASSFLEFKNTASSRVSFGVMLCILSPVMLILLGGLQEVGMIGMSENRAAGAGIAILMALVGVAVALFVVTGIQGSRYEYLEKESIETQYGVDGMARERREKYRPTYIRNITLGIVLCVISVIPLFLTVGIFDEKDELPYIIAIAVLLVIVSLGVLLIVRSCIIKGATDMLLEEGDYTRRNKTIENSPVAKIYWSIVLAVFLAYSFITNRWDISWIIWPVAAVLYGAVIGISGLVRGKG